MRECLNFVKSVNERVLEVQIFAKGLSQADHEDGTVLLVVSITNCVYGRGQDKDGLCHVLLPRSWCWTEHRDGYLIVLLPLGRGCFSRSLLCLFDLIRV